MWINGFHIIGSVYGGRPQYAIPNNSTITLQWETYVLREKVLEEHLEDIAWHTAEPEQFLSKLKRGMAATKYLAICYCVISAAIAILLISASYISPPTDDGLRKLRQILDEGNNV